MIVQIISSYKGIGKFPLANEVYKAIPYPHDKDKLTLVYQVDPISMEKMEKQHSECSEENPLCNVYKEDVINV